MSFKEFLKEKRAWYKTVKSVYCPILGEYVVFNSKGFSHLRYKSGSHERSKKNQMYKLGLLPLVIPVIKIARKIHEYKKEQYSKPLGKYYEIWELREIVGQQNTLVSVVLRRIGNGSITFLSVWKKKDKQTKKPSI
ncbi:MAG: hypothetical protein HYV42_04195 [Candidatus Magasanikbacteria bacterium]|nr:hypothetical protein [Candidatus Magasanikbacteria bacterium]